jgi:hypothetical protein
VDTTFSERKNPIMLRAGGERGRLARALGAAYADGLLSDETFAHRIDALFSAPVIEPARFIGDLRLRGRDRARSWVLATVRTAASRVWNGKEDEQQDGTLLALDWTGARTELLIGRSSACDIVLTDPSVSRRHVRLVYRDGKWVVHDLHSTNGTMLNGEPIGRSELRPGDRLDLGDAHLHVD